VLRLKAEIMTRGSITIRNADPSDLDACFALFADALVYDAFSRGLLREKLWPDRWPPEMRGGALVAEEQGRIVGCMQHVVRASQRKAWIGLFAVASSHRRRGVARELFEHIRHLWPAETEEVEVLAIPGNYFSPGVDPRYTPALAWLEAEGFERFKDCVNMRASLARAFATVDDEARIRAAGVAVRRARPADGTLLDAFFAEHFGPDWRYEASLALEVDPPALHLAIEGDRVIAFAAHSTQNREWGFFGPMGTTPACRGRGVGRVLLCRCLNDLRAAGHASAVIPWVGPVSFYTRAVGAVVERVFWRFRRRGAIR